MTTNPPPVGIDWSTILSIILGSATLSAVLSYVLSSFQIRKKQKMDLIREKLDLYSSIVYHLDKMKFKGDALTYSNQLPKQERFVYSPQEWKELVEDIDKKIQDRYYLLNREILARWVWARTLQTNPISARIVSELRSMLVEEYNKIVDKHLSDMPDIVPKISKDPELDKSTVS